MQGSHSVSFDHITAVVRVYDDDSVVRVYDDDSLLALYIVPCTNLTLEFIFKLIRNVIIKEVIEPATGKQALIINHKH